MVHVAAGNTTTTGGQIVGSYAESPGGGETWTRVLAIADQYSEHTITAGWRGAEGQPETPLACA